METLYAGPYYAARLKIAPILRVGVKRADKVHLGWTHFHFGSFLKDYLNRLIVAYLSELRN